MNDDHSKIIHLDEVRKLRDLLAEDPVYRVRLQSLDKAGLLEEMVRFNEARGGRTELELNLLVQGKLLFSALEEQAYTDELKLLAGTYRRQLEGEIAKKRELLLKANRATLPDE